MGISITITDVANLTSEEKALLAALTDGGQPAEKPAAAPKAEAAPKKKKVVEEKVVEAEVVEDDDEEDDEDLVGGGEPTMADAVARATELVGEKRQQEVKDALAEFGVKRVSELKGGQIGAFLESLAD